MICTAGPPTCGLVFCQRLVEQTNLLQDTDNTYFSTCLVHGGNFPVLLPVWCGLCVCVKADYGCYFLAEEALISTYNVNCLLLRGEGRGALHSEKSGF